MGGRLTLTLSGSYQEVYFQWQPPVQSGGGAWRQGIQAQLLRLASWKTTSRFSCLSSSTQPCRSLIFSRTQSPPSTLTSAKTHSGRERNSSWCGIPSLFVAYLLLSSFPKARGTTNTTSGQKRKWYTWCFLSHLWIHWTTSTMHSDCTDLNMEWGDLSRKTAQKLNKLGRKQALLACTTHSWNQAPSVLSSWRWSAQPVQSALPRLSPYILKLQVLEVQTPSIFFDFPTNLRLITRNPFGLHCGETALPIFW